MGFLGLKKLTEQELQNQTLLAYCQHYSHVDLEKVEECLKKGADPNTRGPDRRDDKKEEKSALHFAVIHWQIKLAEYLIQHGANVNEQNEDGNTALHLAIELHNFFIDRDNISMALMLLANGADASIRNKEGLTPLDLLRKNGTMDLAIRLLELEAPSGWTALPEQNQARLIENDIAIGYRLTSIFNFSSSNVIRHAQHLVTKGESYFVQTFDEYPDKWKLKEARSVLEATQPRM